MSKRATTTASAASSTTSPWSPSAAAAGGHHPDHPESGENDLTWDAGLTVKPVTATFDFSGNSATDGTDGNIRCYTDNGISVNASAWSRDKSDRCVGQGLARPTAAASWRDRQQRRTGADSPTHRRTTSAPGQLRAVRVLPVRGGRQGLPGLRGRRQRRRCGSARSMARSTATSPSPTPCSTAWASPRSTTDPDQRPLGRSERQRFRGQRAGHRGRHHRHLAGGLLQDRPAGRDDRLAFCATDVPSATGCGTTPT